jgi:uncharacterized protein (DUF1778 family)
MELIRGGALSAGMTIADFILESACLRAELSLAEKCDFVAPAKKWKAFAEALDRPAKVNPELTKLFTEKRMSAH